MKTFIHDGEVIRTDAEWRALRPGVSAKTNAANYAKYHGEAGVWTADSKLVAFRRVSGRRVRQFTYPNAIVINAIPENDRAFDRAKIGVRT